MEKISAWKEAAAQSTNLADLGYFYSSVWSLAPVVAIALHVKYFITIVFYQGLSGYILLVNA